MNTSFEALKLKAQLEHLTKAPTLQNANALLSVIKRNKNENFQFVQDVFLTTLLMMTGEADGLNKNEVKTVLLQCVYYILRGSRLKKELPYRTLLIIVTKQIFNFESSSYKSDISEELKIAIFECLEIASRNLDVDVVEAFMVEKNKMILTQCIFVCKEAIAKEKYSKIRKSAIEALMSLMQVHDNADFNDGVLRDQISQIVFLVLPQISAVLLKACQEEIVKGSAVVQTATKALGRYLCLVFEDYERKLSMEIKTEDFSNLLTVKESEVDDLSVLQPKNQSQAEFLQNLKKSSEWIRAAAKRLKPSLEKLRILRGSEHQQVRIELANLSWNLLHKCLVNIKPMVPFLLENLILFSDDSDEKLREFSQSSLTKLSEILPQIDQEVAELFLSHLTVMPRIILTGDDSEQIAGLTLLNSFLLTINSTDSHQLDNPVILEKFLNILLSCCEVEVADDLLFFESNSLGLEDNFYQLKTPWRQLKHLKTPSVTKKFSEICRNIGNSKLGEICVNFLLDNINSVEYLVLLIEVLGKESKVEKTQVEGIVEEFLNETYWIMEIKAREQICRRKKPKELWFHENTPGLYESAVEVKLSDMSLDDDEENSKLTLKRVKYNIISTCLVIEVLGKTAEVLEENFAKFLHESLHRILEKAGNSNLLIRTAGISSLSSIAAALKFPRIPQLIKANSENLLKNIQKLLNEDCESDIVLDLLSVVFKFSETSLTENVKEIVETAADQMTKAKYVKNICGYLKLFRIYVASVKEIDEIIEGECQTEVVQSWEEFLESCLFELKKLPENTEECPEENTENHPEPETSDSTENLEDPPEPEQPWVDESKTIPEHIKLINKILSSSLQFFASSNPSEVILTHEIFTYALPVLHKFENQFLPMVHQLWYPFTKQFKVKNPVILQYSFRLFVLIAELAKDFVNGRSIDDIFPVTNDFLYQSFEKTNKKENLSYTQEFKLQREILKGYGSLAVNLEFDEKHLNQVADVLLKFEKHSNETLANESKESLRILKDHDPGLILLKTMF